MNFIHNIINPSVSMKYPNKWVITKLGVNKSFHYHSAFATLAILQDCVPISTNILLFMMVKTTVKPFCQCLLYKTCIRH